MIKKTTMNRLLEDIEKTDEGLSVFLPEDFGSLKSNTPCILINDKYGEIESKKISNTVYIDVILVGTVQDIIDNLRQQIQKPTVEQQLRAIDFYLENDAFIEVPTQME